MSTTIIYHDSGEGPSTDIENGGLAHLILRTLELDNLPIMAHNGLVPTTPFAVRTRDSGLRNLIEWKDTERWHEYNGSHDSARKVLRRGCGLAGVSGVAVHRRRVAK
jgi:hypothetical protein